MNHTSRRAKSTRPVPARTGRRRLATLALVAALVTLSPALAPAHADDANAGLTPRRVDAFMADYLDSSALTGATIAVTRGTDVVRTAGYGHDSTGAPMRDATPMGVASVSKAFTALAVMQLVEKAHVRLDAPARDYLPEFSMADPRSAEITVRQLLDQSSGMSDTAFAEKSEPQPDSLKGAVARLTDARLVADPGTESHYTNPNYHVAARLVEVVSGQSFAAYLDDHVFTPLGMDQTTTVDTSEDVMRAGVPRGHIAVLQTALAVGEPHGFFNGAGGIVTTAEDMAAWLIAQNNAGVGADGARILSAEGIEETHTPSDPTGRKGLGWDSWPSAEGTPTIQHGGVQWTFTAQQRLIPGDGYGIAVMADSGLGRGDSRAIVDGLTALAEGSSVEDAVSTPAGPLLALDVTMAALCLGTLALGVRGIRRAPTWVERRWARPRWATALRCLPYIAAVLAFALVDRLAGLLQPDRDLPWWATVYYAPAVMLWLAVVAAVAIAVLAARAVHACRRGRSAELR